jgi:hypothetical protein
MGVQSLCLLLPNAEVEAASWAGLASGPCSSYQEVALAHKALSPEHMEWDREAAQ